MGENNNKPVVKYPTQQSHKSPAQLASGFVKNLARSMPDKVSNLAKFNITAAANINIVPQFVRQQVDSALQLTSFTAAGSNSNGVQFVRFQRIVLGGDYEEMLFLILGYDKAVQIWKVTETEKCEEVFCKQFTSSINGASTTLVFNRAKNSLFLALGNDRTLEIIQLNCTEEAATLTFNFENEILDLKSNEEILLVASRNVLIAVDNTSFKEIFKVDYVNMSDRAVFALSRRFLAFPDYLHSDNNDDFILPNMVQNKFSEDFNQEDLVKQMSSKAVQHVSSSYKFLKEQYRDLNQSRQNVYTGPKSNNKFEYETSNSISKAQRTRRFSSVYREDLFQNGAKSSSDSFFDGYGSNEPLANVDEESRIKNGNVSILDTKTHSVLSTFKCTKDAIDFLGFDNSGLLMAVATESSNYVAILKFADNNKFRHIYNLYRGITRAKVVDLSFSETGHLISVFTNHGTCHVFPVNRAGGHISIYSHPIVVSKQSSGHNYASTSIRKIQKQHKGDTEEENRAPAAQSLDSHIMTIATIAKDSLTQIKARYKQSGDAKYEVCFPGGQHPNPQSVLEFIKIKPLARIRHKIPKYIIDEMPLKQVYGEEHPSVNWVEAANFSQEFSAFEGTNETEDDIEFNFNGNQVDGRVSVVSHEMSFAHNFAAQSSEKQNSCRRERTFSGSYYDGCLFICNAGSLKKYMLYPRAHENGRTLQLRVFLKYMWDLNTYQKQNERASDKNNFFEFLKVSKATDDSSSDIEDQWFSQYESEACLPLENNFMFNYNAIDIIEEKNDSDGTAGKALDSDQISYHVYLETPSTEVTSGKKTGKNNKMHIRVAEALRESSDFRHVEEVNLDEVSDDVDLDNFTV